MTEIVAPNRAVFDHLLYWKQLPTGEPALSPIVEDANVPPVPYIKLTLPRANSGNASDIIIDGGFNRVEIKHPPGDRSAGQTIVESDVSFTLATVENMQVYCIGPGLAISPLNKLAANFPPELSAATEWPETTEWTETVEIADSVGNTIRTGFSTAAVNLFRGDSTLSLATSGAPWVTNGRAAELVAFRDANKANEPWTMTTLGGAGSEGDFTLRSLYASRDDVVTEGIYFDPTDGTPRSARSTTFYCRQPAPPLNTILSLDGEHWDDDSKLWSVREVALLDRSRFAQLDCYQYSDIL